MMPPAVSAQSPSPEAASSSQEHGQILSELKAIRQLLEKLAANPAQPAIAAARPPAAADAKVTLTGLSGPMLGKPEAPLTMVEFTDLQCPYCRRFHMTAFEQIKKNYIDTGRLRYLSRDFPLDSLHPLAQGALQATRCAGEQGKYWDMRHRILVHPTPLSMEVFGAVAGELKLDPGAFKTCLAAAPLKFQADVQKDLAEGRAVGVTGTPSFIIGLTRGNSLEGARLVGSQPYSVFDAKLKELLATLNVQ